jgi:hypothetical protein
VFVDIQATKSGVSVTSGDPDFAEKLERRALSTVAGCDILSVTAPLGTTGSLPAAGTKRLRYEITLKGVGPIITEDVSPAEMKAMYPKGSVTVAVQGERVFMTTN